MEYERISPTKKVRVGSEEWKKAKKISKNIYEITIDRKSQLPEIKGFKYIRVERLGDKITIIFEGEKMPTKQELQAILDYLSSPFIVKEIKEVI